MIFNFIEVTFGTKNGQNFEKKFWKFKNLLKMSKGIIGESFRLIRYVLKKLEGYFELVLEEGGGEEEEGEKSQFKTRCSAW